MARPALSLYHRRTLKDSFRDLFFLLISLALMTSLFILFYVSSTSLKSETIIQHPQPYHPLIHLNIKPALHDYYQLSSSSYNSSAAIVVKTPPVMALEPLVIPAIEEQPRPTTDEIAPLESHSEVKTEKQWSRGGAHIGLYGNRVDNMEDVFHDRDIFTENYQEMNRSLKIYVYPHSRDDPYANVLLPDNSEPGGNYASESYFKKALMNSHFITKDPSEADLYFLPFSIASLRHDRRVGVAGIKDFVRDYIFNISHSYPYWNRTGGADHFYVACHSVGRTAMEKAVEVKLNAIQVVCSSSYFLAGYVAHKDASVPQIWPRRGSPPKQAPSKRKKLAFYAGAMNSKVRESLVQMWSNDSEISVHHRRLKTPYAEALLGSRFCIHAKGYEVNTARIGDAIYYGCVPVILADHYDLPFADILNWRSFSIVVSAMDIPLLKKTLKDTGLANYLKLQRNVVKVQSHFQWHNFPIDFDAFYMVMFELWLRRNSVRVPLSTFVD